MQRKQPSKGKYGKIAALSSLGLMLPSCTIVGFIFGYLLDKLFGTDPWMLFIFLFLGTVSGFYSLIRGLNKLKDE